MLYLLQLQHSRGTEIDGCIRSLVSALLLSSLGGLRANARPSAKHRASFTYFLFVYLLEITQATEKQSLARAVWPLFGPFLALVWPLFGPFDFLRSIDRNFQTLKESSSE